MTSNQLNYNIFDVFTTKAYEGNPLALVIVPANSSLRQDQKQKIAKEFNLSETVFVHEAGPGKDIPIDIFMPDVELPFAGHPTIGSAYYLLNGPAPDSKAVLTKAGRIPIRMNSAGKDVLATVPHDVHLHRVQVPCSLPGAKSGVPFSIVKGMTFILVELPDEATLALASQPLGGITVQRLDDGWQSGFLGTYYYVKLAVDEHGRHLIRARMWDSFEDPATGSAACALTSYLTLQTPTDQGAGPFKYTVIQGVEMGRPSQILTSVSRTTEGVGIQAVNLGGTAVKVMEGWLTCPA